MDQSNSNKPVILYDGSKEHGKMEPSKWENTAQVLQTALSGIQQPGNQKSQGRQA
jgi:hypothetical protein